MIHYWMSFYSLVSLFLFGDPSKQALQCSLDTSFKYSIFIAFQEWISNRQTIGKNYSAEPISR